MLNEWLYIWLYRLPAYRYGLAYPYLTITTRTRWDKLLDPAQGKQDALF